MRNAHGERPADAGGKVLFSEEELRSLTGNFAGAASQWSAFYRTFMRSDLWREIAREAKVLAEWKCKWCGLPSKNLHCHHLTYIRFGGQELQKDLIVLCEGCHAKADDERREAMQALKYLNWQRGRYAVFMKRVYGEDWSSLAYCNTPASYKECEEWWEERIQAREFEPDEDFGTDDEE